MDAALKTTVETLLVKITAKENEANELKKLVNGLCRDAGQPEPFADIKDAGQTLSRLRSDQFYGQPIAAAVRSYLELRKAAGLGAASVGDIYSALKQGGFKFEAKDDENAKNGVRISLKKNASIFHQLPHGDWGLLMWYPRPASRAEKDTEEAKKSASPTISSKVNQKPNENKAEDASESFLTNDQIRAVLFGIAGQFKASDLEVTLTSKYPNLKPRPTAIPTLLFQLKKNGQLKIVKERSGRSGAIYEKA